MKLKYKFIFFMLPLMLYMGECEQSCWGVHNPAGPDDPIEKVEYYDWVLTYVRPAIYQPQNPDPISVYLQCGKEYLPRRISLIKVDEYTFTAEIIGLPTHLKDENKPSNLMYIVDAKRFIEEQIIDYTQWGKPHSVGDIFIMKNKKTGYEHRLLKIVENSLLLPAVPAWCEPKAASSKTVKGGTIIDE